MNQTGQDSSCITDWTSAMNVNDEMDKDILSIIDEELDYEFGLNNEDDESDIKSSEESDQEEKPLIFGNKRKLDGDLCLDGEIKMKRFNDPVSEVDNNDSLFNYKIYDIFELVNGIPKSIEMGQISKITIVDIQFGYITRNICHYFPMEYFISHIQFSPNKNKAAVYNHMGVVNKPLRYRDMSKYDRERQYNASKKTGLPWKNYRWATNEFQLQKLLKKYIDESSYVIVRGAQKQRYLNQMIDIPENKIVYFKTPFENKQYCKLHNFMQKDNETPMETSTDEAPLQQQREGFVCRCAKKRGYFMLNTIMKQCNVKYTICNSKKKST